MTISMNDAQQLYQDNLVETNGELHIVIGFDVNDDGVTILQLRNLSTGTITWQIADPEAIHCPVKYRLGYVQLNMESNALWLTRSPRRQYSIGWTQQNVSGLPVLSTLRAAHASFLNSLQGKFPTFEKCRELVATRAVDVAFDKQFALRHCGQYIMYRGSVALDISAVGVVSHHSAYPANLVRLFEEVRGMK